MDTLRATLVILFNEISVETLLNVKAGGDQSLFDRERFRRAYQALFPSYSADQCDLIASMISSFYLKGIPNDNSIAFCPHSSVFNVLLHFSQVVLTDRPKLQCEFKHILRWDSVASLLGEDLFTTSYLASIDVIRRNDRSSFDWKLVLDQNHPLLNDVLCNVMADVHMHLKGSSGNFDLNWLSLMNHPYKREKQFKELDAFLSPVLMMGDSDRLCQSLHAQVIKASTIRYYLYVVYVKKQKMDSRTVNLINSIINDGNGLAVMHVDELDSKLAAERIESDPKGLYRKHDYACLIDDNDIKKTPNVIISGERRILYSSFKACYSGCLPYRDSALLYAYILIKNRIRRELTQINGFAGFGNFSSYEKRKTLFIAGMPDYENLVEPWAIGQYFIGDGDRYVEPRITPKLKGKDLCKNINNIDVKLRNLTSASNNNVHYVFHFIKSKDESKNEGVVINPRHHKLREIVRHQAFAINEFRKVYPNHQRVVGIDAANSEIFARPEIFAQAFRYLKNSCVDRRDGERVYTLGMTYHVGEDYLSPFDGLRAIDEVVHFLRFGENSRLGHALVLGIDPERYLKIHHNTLLLPRQIVLDDVAWCLQAIYEEPSIAFAAQAFEKMFYDVFQKVYGTNNKVTPMDYYESWLLRGDNPLRYSGFELNHRVDTSAKVTEWSAFDLNDEPASSFSRNNNLACKLFYHYHYNMSVRMKGGIVMEVHYPKGAAEVIETLQKRLLKQLRKRQIGIETNPTSNKRIGGFELYQDLPLFKFFPISNIGHHTVLSSINTDDRGIFTTSLEREYALLAAAITKSGMETPCSDSMIDACDWLDTIRNSGWDQRFIRHVSDNKN